MIALVLIQIPAVVFIEALNLTTLLLLIKGVATPKNDVKSFAN